MLYENMAAAADKWLRSDGSVTTMAGERVLPPDPARAALYENMTPNVAVIASDKMKKKGD